ncbi:MAG: BCD family MFS transporter, partial [Pseudomonadota bacterium]
MATVITLGALNRVLIVEIGAPATIVSLMVALPILAAPFRTLIGFKSDTHRSALGWRRTPYLWFGTLMQFGGLALMPFALIVMTGDGGAPVGLGQAACALAFLLIGIGIHTTQTAGLALATDLAKPESRPRVTALMYTMLLIGMLIASIVFGLLLLEFTPLRLVQVIQGAAGATLVLNLAALWKQEPRDRARAAAMRVAPATSFSKSWRALIERPGLKRFLAAIALGAAAFSMQDVLLEPYGGEVLKLSVASTTMLTAIFTLGGIAAFALAARLLTAGWDPYRLAAYGVLAGLPGFSLILMAGAVEAALLFRIGAFVIGFGGGLFAVATLTAAAMMDEGGRVGLALGAWGAVQATAAGAAIAASGPIRDAVSALAQAGALGPALGRRGRPEDDRDRIGAGALGPPATPRSAPRPGRGWRADARARSPR